MNKAAYVKGSENTLFAAEDGSVRTEPVEHPSKLDGDVARTNDRDLLRQCFQVKETIRVDAVFLSRDVWDQWLAADSDQNVLRLDFFPVDFDVALRIKSCSALK